MKSILGNLTFVEVYLDDIIIHSIYFTSHIKHCIEVFKILLEADLKINPSKCVWASPKVYVFGHIVSS
jgi:hypothetical protein